MVGVSQFLKDYGPSFAWIIAAVGWAITNSQANTREKRKEVRAEIAAIEEKLGAILEKLAEYLRNPVRDERAQLLELEIVVGFQSLDLMHERLAKRQQGGAVGLYIDAIKKYQEEFFDLATGSYFETAVRMPEKDVNPRIQALHAKAFLLIESLHSFFLAKFDGISTPSAVRTAIAPD